MPGGDGTGPYNKSRRKGMRNNYWNQQTNGIIDNCVCSNCGTGIPHQRGIPCNQISQTAILQLSVFIMVYCFQEFQEFHPFSIIRISMIQLLHRRESFSLLFFRKSSEINWLKLMSDTLLSHSEKTNDLVISVKKILNEVDSLISKSQFNKAIDVLQQ